MDELLDLYVIEYSRRQDQFHCHLVRDMLRTNRGILLRGEEIDYLPVDFARTSDEASERMEQIRSRTVSGDWAR